ncbi:presenilins-associated rhomboid-like protein, mitochondrial isoform X2 [Esox lucius]|uniref:presenilins-associated rhomboid-like protein, mitochondrial isoform X2 n=1 Tax=Esox lucius TaxID=8010 RepID=UPI001476FCEC|nr:presenilins-associated rhomboid-like protein, mitochondrial isoform X2 [Esox lucius]
MGSFGSFTNMAWRGCILRWFRSDISITASTGNRFSINTQQRCGFRKAVKETKTKKGSVEETGSSHAEQSEGLIHKKGASLPAETQLAYTPPRNFGQLVKPLVFTVGINQWWNSLSEGHRTVSGIIAANVVVFCCWRVPSLQRSMMKYFTSNPASKTLCLPMLLSTFSHYSFFHMAANMYVLWSFSSSIVSILGREQFLAVYLSAGVISTMFSYVCKTASGRLGPSLGASGAIMTVLAAVCTKMPEAKLAIIFLPMYAFSAGTALKAILAMDTAGLFLGWRYFDHAAHLGGALFGMWYIMYGHELIWKNREPLVKVWHDLRTKGPGRGGSGGSGPL